MIRGIVLVFISFSLTSLLLNRDRSGGSLLHRVLGGGSYEASVPDNINTFVHVDEASPYVPTEDVDRILMAMDADRFCGITISSRTTSNMNLYLIAEEETLSAEDQLKLMKETPGRWREFTSQEKALQCRMARVVINQFNRIQ